MSRDIVVLRSTGRASRVTPTDSTYTGIATETGPVADRLFEEVDTTTSAPVNLVLSSDTLFNNVYVAATWDPAPDPNVVGYQVVFARAGVSNTFRVETEAAWFEPAMGGEDYDVTVSNVYVNGVLGANTVTDSITAATDNTIPDTPSGLQLGVGIRSVTVGWDENTELDMEFGLGQYSVQLSNDGTFAGADIIHETVVGGLVATFSDLATNTQYWARVAAVDTSGNTSAYSGALSGTTGQIVNDDIADSAIIGSAKIQNASIEFGQIVSLQANQLIAGSGFVNQLTVASGGAIKSSDYDAAPTVNGWYIGTNSAVFNNVTVRGTLEGVDGDFEGTLSVGSGNKIFRVNSSGDLWIGHATETSAPFRVENDGGLIATDATITGNVTASSLTVSGASTLGSTLRMTSSSSIISTRNVSGAVGERIELQGNSNRIKFFDDTTAISSSYIEHDSAADALRLDADNINLICSNGGIVMSTSANIEIEPTFDCTIDAGYSIELFAGDASSDEFIVKRGGSSGQIIFRGFEYSSADAAVMLRIASTSSAGFADIGFGIVGTYSSRKATKEWWQAIDPAAGHSRIMQLEPVDFTYKKEAIESGNNDMVPFNLKRGLIVEDAAAVDDSYVEYGWLDKDDPLKLAGSPSDMEGMTMDEWVQKNHPLEDAVPTMWDHYAVIADLVASVQHLTQELDTLKNTSNGN